MNEHREQQKVVRLWHDNGPDCLCAWPVGLPRDFDEMYRTFKDFVEKKVQSYNKVERNFEDLLGEIWLKLIHADLLNKFVARAARALPETIFAHEAADLMGLTWEEFTIALYHMPKSKMGLNFNPVEVTDDNKLVDVKMKRDHKLGVAIVDREALFKISDVEALDDAYPKYGQAARTLPRRITLELQSLGFKAYLTQAIHNHFVNWCRTRKRRYQDLLLPATAIVQVTDTGAYQHTGHNFEATDWESRLVSLAMNDEDMLTVVEAVELEFASAGLDIRSVSETETYVGDDEKVHTRPTAEALRSLELLDAMADGRATHPTPHRKPKAMRATGYLQARHEATNFGDGKTIREAVKVQQRAEIRARSRVATPE